MNRSEQAPQYGQSLSRTGVSAAPSSVPLLVMGTTVSQLDGPPNVPRSISVYGYCVRACAGAAKVSAGTIAAAISIARRLLMVVALSRWLVRCEATELRRRSRGMQAPPADRCRAGCGHR